MNFIEEIKQKAKKDLYNTNLYNAIEKGLDTLSRYIDIDELTTFCNEFNLKLDIENEFAFGNPDEYFLDYSEALKLDNNSDITYGSTRYVLIGWNSQLDNNYSVSFSLTFDSDLKKKLEFDFTIFKEPYNVEVSFFGHSIKELEKEIDEWSRKA